MNISKITDTWFPGERITAARLNATNSKVNEVIDAVNYADGVYGVRHYYNLSSPTLTRFPVSGTTDADLHKDLPVQSLMRRCLLKDDGTVNYYLSATDSTKKEDGTAATLDGTDGQVMVEIPEHYRRHTNVVNATDSTQSYYETAISLSPFTGAFKVNKCYISAYEAAMDRTNSKLSSVVNTTAQYRGGGNDSSWDGTYRSLLGRPATVISLTNFRTYARNRGAKWNCQEFDIYTTLYWLYTVEYASLNCQLAYNASRDTDGHMQGGLGAGVTGFSSWGDFNSYYPFVPCGTTNSLGNATGVVSYNVTNSSGTTIYAAPVPSYRGVENPFGHVWKWTDGYIGVGDGSKQNYYTCNNRASYASSVNSSYILRGNISSGGWFKYLVKDTLGNLLISGVGADSATYFCDYSWEANGNGTTYGLFTGSSALIGAYAGFACLNAVNAPSDTYAYFGSRLCWSNFNSIYE